MSRLDELIQELCPDGVEYFDLENICQISKGIQFNKKDMNDYGTYPVMNGGVKPSGYIEQYNQKENTITISQGGASAGYVNWIKTKFWAGAHCYIIKPTDNILNRYLFHFIKSKEYKLQECQYGAGIPALAKSTVASLKIPLPPLPVQQEIVRILDNFTELTTELTAELTARKKQYDYYREKLLNSEKTCLFSIGSICNSISSGKNKIRLDDGKYPVYGSTGIISFTDRPIYNKKQILIARVGANCGFVNIADGKYDVSDNTLIVDLKDNISLKYIYYKLVSMDLNKYAKGGGQPLITSAQIKKLNIAIPALQEQNKIVDILDRFDALCNDLTCGLPAEIEARQKQYEYYRDKLLTFKELKK